jgi:hypothetical protein
MLRCRAKAGNFLQVTAATAKKTRRNADSRAIVEKLPANFPAGRETGNHSRALS